MLVQRRDDVRAYLDDDALLARILQHVDNGTTDTCERSWREPVANYRSDGRFAAELERVLRAVPVPFCPSAAVPDPGSYVAREAAGVPILVVRDRDGTVRAFRNACRHRGSSLVSGRDTTRAFVCPFHGWVYRLDGSLRHVPGEHGFPGLDRSARGLVPVGVVEHGALVFVDQSGRNPEPDALSCPSDLVRADQSLFRETRVELDVNWKVFTEGFLEGYHLRATHPTTFLPLGYDNLTVIEHWGRNSRIVFPFKRIERLRDQRPVNLDGAITTVHHLFPNAIVARLSHHTALVVIEPIDVGRSVVIGYELMNARSDRTSAERDNAFVDKGIAEDRDAARRVQRGLVSGANEFLEFGRFEGALGHFHRHLDELLA